MKRTALTAALVLLYFFSFAQEWDQSSPTPSTALTRSGTVGLSSRLTLTSTTYDNHLHITRNGYGAAFRPDDSPGTKGLAIDPLGVGSTIHVNGKFGVGTNSPLAKLHLSVSSDIFLLSGNDNTFASGDIVIQRTSSSGSAGRSASVQLQDVSAATMTIIQAGPQGYQVLMYSPTYGWNERMMIAPNGNIGIGTNAPDAKLAVNGQVHATEVRVTTTVPGPDYVFEPEYKLPSLQTIKSYIQQYKHLPDVPTAKEMETVGVKIGEMNMLLLKKVEELTLYLIEMEEKNNKLQTGVEELQQVVNKKRRR